MALAPDPLHSLFDGWATVLEPDEDFVWQDRKHILDFDEPEDEDLGPYESPTLIPIVTDWPQGWFNTPDGKSGIPYHYQSMAWSSFNLGLQSLAKIIGGRGEAFQTNTYDETGKLEQPTYNFRFHPGELGWQCAEGSRL